MCETCGCSKGAEVTMTHLQEGHSPIMMDGLQAHSHPHGPADSHEHSHHHREAMCITITLMTTSMTNRAVSSL